MLYLYNAALLRIREGGWTEPLTQRISDHSKLRWISECDDVHIARSSTHKNVRRRRTVSWQRSSMYLSSWGATWGNRSPVRQLLCPWRKYLVSFEPFSDRTGLEVTKYVPCRRLQCHTTLWCFLYGQLVQNYATARLAY